MSSASPTAAAASPKPPPGGGAARTFAINEAIAVGVLVALAIHGLLRFLGLAVEVPGLAALWELLPAWRPLPPTVADLPLLAMLLIGGAILVAELLAQVMAGVFGADLLAGVAILTSLLLGEWLAGVLVVLMLSGGKALEARAVSRAGSVLEALARRMPTLAHRREGGGIVDVPLAEVAVGDVVVVFPHEICPVDGEVVAGHGTRAISPASRGRCRRRRGWRCCRGRSMARERSRSAPRAWRATAAMPGSSMSSARARSVAPASAGSPTPSGRFTPRWRWPWPARRGG
jgi:hypothetical protein